MTLHYDGITISEATQLQNALRSQVQTAEEDFNVTVIAGADISLNLYSSTIYAGILLLSFPFMQPIAYSLVKAETHFPYVPGFLAFREVPALVAAWNELPKKPDVLVVDGHGIAHPRRLGIAAHFGVVTGQRSIGCAKKLLFGKYEEPVLRTGAYSIIFAKEEPIGYAFRSKATIQPVFISPGHRMGLENSRTIIEQCIGKYRIPEPTRLAHELVNRFRRGELSVGYQQI